MKAKVLFLLKFILARFATKSRYKIVRGYFHRKTYSYFNDTQLTDDFQNDVYKAAKKYAERSGYKTILDMGCGSGFKLMKYFLSYDTVGIDVAETVRFLKDKYPTRTWLTTDESLSVKADMVICSDVIEHVLDPDQLLKKILSFSPKTIVISTPDRKLLDMSDYFGPPRNSHHIREWTFNEFREYLSDHVKIIDQVIINYDQKTQMAICEPKR